MSAEIHSETKLYRVESRAARKLVWIEATDAVATRLWRVLPERSLDRRPTGPWLQLNYLRGVNVFACANFAEQLFTRGGVEIQYRKRGTPGLISAERHGGDVDAMLAEQGPDPPDHSGTIRVFQHQHHALRSSFDRSAVDAHNSRRGPEKCAAD